MGVQMLLRRRQLQVARHSNAGSVPYKEAPVAAKGTQTGQRKHNNG